MDVEPPKSSDGYVISVTLSLQPDKLDAFFDLLRPVHAIAKETPECAWFVVGVNKQEGVVEVKLTEAWIATKDWLFTVQGAKPYVKAFYEAVEPLTVKPRAVEILDYVPAWTYFRTK